ncbi:hypothetical protein F4780DRAFT_625797 [Xylariomycetidae sp. FL0641]|nr:hypothetical protein F4780DRAFT_625797 [Xylariomycetidae sp. FL0641]
MDPVSAIQFASSILAFLEFSFNLVRGTYELHQSGTGATAENVHVSNVLADLQQVTDDLHSDIAPQDRHERELCKLASHCRALSDDLAELLERLQWKEKDGKWKAVRVAWLSMLKQKEVKSIEGRLGEYRAQIMLRLNSMICIQGSSFQQQLNRLDQRSTKLVGESASHSKLLEDLIQQLRQGSHQPALTDIRSSLVQLTSQISTTMERNTLLEALYFPQMHSREDVVDDAFCGTFDWVLEDSEESADGDSESGSGGLGDDSSEPDDDDSSSQASWQTASSDLPWRGGRLGDEERFLRRKTSSLLNSFIREDHGLFYVSGKAGSGKSTLMRFLSKDRRFLEGLQRWSGAKTLVFARFFFWNSGDKLQMSLEGLYRSILFDILKESPSLLSRMQLKHLACGGSRHRPP